MTASSDDEKLAALVGEGGQSGLAAYGAYWRFLEIIASQMEGKDPSCSVSYPVWRWSQKLFVRKSYLCSVLSELKKQGLLVIEGDPNVDESITVKAPNLLKYRDEYSKKSGHSPKNVPPRTEGEGEGEGDKEETVRKKSSATSAEPSDKAAGSTPIPERKPAGSLPLNTGENFVIFEDQILDWQETFPAVNIRQQLAEMREWCKANPTKRKTKTGVLRFVVAWLSKEQDRGRVQTSTGGNGHYVNGNGSKPTITEQANAHLRAALRNEGIEDGPDQAGDDAPGGGNGQSVGLFDAGDLGAKPGIVLVGAVDRGVRPSRG